MCYYTDQTGLNNLIRVTKECLKENGIIVATHTGPEAAYTKFSYGSLQEPVVTSRLAEAAKLYNMSIASVQVWGKWYFPDLPQKTLSEFEELKNWRKHDIFSPEGGWLRGLLFHVHADLIPEIAAKGKLPDAIREFCRMMKRDEFGVYVENETKIQVMCNESENAKILEESCEDVKSRMPELLKKVSKARLSLIASQIDLRDAGRIL